MTIPFSLRIRRGERATPPASLTSFAHCFAPSYPQSRTSSFHTKIYKAVLVTNYLNSNLQHRVLTMRSERRTVRTAGQHGREWLCCYNISKSACNDCGNFVRHKQRAWKHCYSSIVCFYWYS
ncbi:MAG: hypothetical protein ACJAXV_000831 [Bacteroidia bacterium]|jgi:hypothetical protein